MAHPKDQEQYKRITVTHGEESFSAFCSQHSFNYRRAEVKDWVGRLTRQLGWNMESLLPTKGRSFSQKGVSIN